jgi:HK97 family phage major capsid protein
MKQVVEMARGLEMQERTALLPILARNLALAGGRSDDALRFAQATKAPDRVIQFLKAPVSAHDTNDADLAGMVDARVISTSFQTLLRNSSLFFRLLDNGLVRVPLRTRVGFTAASATAFVVGEGAAVPLSRMEIAGNVLEPTKVAALVVLTDEMIRSGGSDAEALIARELRRAVSHTVDEAFLAIAADNAPSTPSAGPDAADAMADLRTLLTAVQPSAESRLLFAMSADVGRAAATLLTATGGRLFPLMGPVGGTMIDVPAMVVDAMEPGTLALLDAAGIAGNAGLVTVEASNDTTVEMESEPDGDSTTPTATTLVSMFQTNSTAILARATFGVHRFRDDAVAVVEGVDWGNEGSPA